jgi:hypothetical protein
MALDSLGANVILIPIHRTHSGQKKYEKILADEQIYKKA